MKLIAVTIVAIAVNGGLFFLMNEMIDRDRGRLVDTYETQTIDFVRTPLEENTRTKDRRRKPPPKPEEVKKPQARMDHVLSETMELPSPIAALEITSIVADSGVMVGERLANEAEGTMETIMERDLIPVTKFPPQYPPRALLYGVEGVVEIHFLVWVDGTVREARVVDSRPEGRFDKAALDAVRRWRYRPLVIDGVATSVWARVLVEFEMHE